MSAARIRPVESADLADIAVIYNHYVRTATVTFDEIPSTEADWHVKAARIREAGVPFLVAIDDTGAVQGYALGYPWSPKSAYRYTVENSIYLAPAAAGRGIGSRLLAAFLDACRDSGLHHVIAVIADEGAEASLTMHRRAGFLDAGHLTRTGVKFGREIGVRFLQLDLRTAAAR